MDHGRSKPLQSISDGIASVWVNGESVWQNQQPTNAPLGVFAVRAVGRE